MSRKDEQIMATDRRCKERTERLLYVTDLIASLKQEQRTIIFSLLRSGLTTRFVGKLSGMSHQTISKIGKVDKRAEAVARGDDAR